MTASAVAAPTSNVAVPNSGSSQFASLYVGDLDPLVTEQMLFAIFNSIGPIASIRVCRDSITRRSLGYAYVNFNNPQDAERALNTLNYSEIKGRCCRIMWSHRDPALRKSGNGNVFVKNLDKTIDNKALNDTFSLFGNISSCKVATDLEGKSRGFGFVHFENEESAKAAIEKLNGMQLGEKIVFVGEFQKHTARDADGTVKPFTNVYIKHIPQSIEEQKLKEMCGEFGQITSTFLTEDHKKRRFAFVNYEDFDSAARCVEELHGKDVRTDEEKKAYLEMQEQKKKDEADGISDVQSESSLKDDVPETQLFVGRAMTKIERMKYLRNKYYSKSNTTNDRGSTVVPTTGSNLYVKNLGEQIDDEGLREMFSEFGTITSAKVQKEGGLSRGFGFVCFSSPEEATKAVTEMHLKLIAGKPLYVALHERRDQRLERLRSHYKGGGGAGMFNGNGGRGFGPSGGLYQGQLGMYGQNSFGGRPSMGGPGSYGPSSMGLRGMPSMGGAYGAGMQPARMPYGAAPNMMAPQMRGPAMFGKGKGMPMGMPTGAGPRMPMASSMGPSAMQRPPTMPMNRSGMPPNQLYDSHGPLTAAALAAAPPQVQKQMLGEKLFPLVARAAPELAGKITGMMLEMDNSELLILLESEGQLRYKIDEAVKVLEGNM